MADKTLVVWAAPATLDQRGGSALTLDNGSEAFDGIVFGEIEPKRWMPGSNGWNRTEKKQAAWAAENARADQFVQIAIVYRGKDVAVYRNGQSYANYTMASAPQTFGPSSVVLFGRRHLTAGDPANSFAGRIKDARIYAKPLDAATLAALRPGQVSAELPPWAWWSFADEGLREKTGRFRQTTLLGDARLDQGCLVLAGKGATVIAARVSGGDGSASTPIPRAWSSTDPRARRGRPLHASAAGTPFGRSLSPGLSLLPAGRHGLPWRPERARSSPTAATT